MEEGEENYSNSIEQEQKEQQIQPQPPIRNTNPQAIQQAQPEQIRNQDNQQAIEQQKQNQVDPPVQNIESQEDPIENEDDRLEEQLEDQEVQEQNVNRLIQGQQQLQADLEQPQQRSPSIQQEVENQVQSQVEQQKQLMEQIEAQPEQQNEQQDRQNDQSEEREPQQPVLQNPAPVQHPHQFEQADLQEGQEVQPNIVHISHQQPNNQNIQNAIDQQNQARIIQKERQDQYTNAQIYIHRLERQLEAAVTEKIALKEDLSVLRQAQVRLRQEFQVSKQNAMDLRRKKLQTQIQKTKAIKECEKLKKENQVHRKKLEEIEKIGDIIVLKNALQELKILSQVQKQEIEELKSSHSLPLIENLNQRLELIQRYEQNQKIHQLQIQKLNTQNKTLAEDNKKLSNKLAGQKDQFERLRQKQASSQEQILDLNNTIRNWQTKWNDFEAERQSNTKARQLEKKIFDYESQRNLGYESELIHLNVLSDREEKDIILREYLLLQGKYNQQNFEFQQAKAKLRKLQRQQNRVYANYIKKKEYIDLSAKYRKAKKCLQGAFQQLRLMGNDESQNQNVEDEVNELLQGIQARQSQKLIKNTQKIVSNLQDKIDSLENNEDVALSQREHQHLQQIIAGFKNQQANNQRLMKLMAEDISLKNRLIAEKNEIIGTLRKRTLLVPTQAENYKKTIKLQNEVSILKQTISIFETQNILLVKQISALNSQVAHWNFLYNSIKQSLKDKINSSLESMGSNGTVRIAGQETASICRECEQRRLFLSSKQFESMQTQTDNLTQFYYKEIKDILAYLNKVSRECDKIPNLSKEFGQILHQIRQKFVTEFKEKYLRIQSIYTGKMNQLKRERADNEAWRSRTKEQIREEFQDIRDLVINNRLANALRQAKNLIDYLQAEAYKQDDENQAEEMEEENPAPEAKNQ